MPVEPDVVSVQLYNRVDNDMSSMQQWGRYLRDVDHVCEC